MKPKRSVLDPDLRVRARRAAAAQDRLTVKLFVRAGTEKIAAAWVRKVGGRVRSTTRGILLADLAASSLKKLEGEAWARRAEGSRVLIPFVEDLPGPPGGGTNAAREFHTRRTGKGVVVGIIDSGVDWTHPDFRTRDGRTRIEVFIHATQRGPRAFDSARIDAALRGRNVRIPLGDAWGHGTHCASIAAGNGNALRGREFRGVAPEATLMAIRCDELSDDLLMWGIQEIFARAGDRPAVINVSLGHHQGAHDGTSGVERIISRESKRGRIVVVAAGNDARRNLHWRGRLETGSERVIRCHVRDPAQQFVEVWIARGDRVRPMIETPDGKLFDPRDRWQRTPFGRFMATWDDHGVNRDTNLRLVIENATVPRTWKIRLQALNVLNGEVFAWAGAPSEQTAVDLLDNTTGRQHSIAMPATEERAIAVASWAARNTYKAIGGIAGDRRLAIGELAKSSSEGPTRIGMLKPDIAAPGLNITAALAANSDWATKPKQVAKHHPSGRYITKSGTSAAAPFVTGVVALMLEGDPTLTPEDVQQRMRVTAWRDARAGAVWNSGFGFGKINVPELLAYSE